MKLTQRQLDVLNHFVADGQEWDDNSKEAHFLAKIEKYESAYDEAIANGNYQTRKQRDDAETKAEQDAYDNVPYSEKRRREYPPMEDYLDGIVKGDTAQVDKYISDCLAVKNKHPKE